MITFIGKKVLPYAGMAMVVVVVGYFAIQNHRNFEKTIVAQAQHQLLDTVRFEAQSMNQEVTNLTRGLEILSEEVVVQESFANRFNKKSSGFLLLDDAFKDVRSLATSLSMIDAKGFVIYEVPARENIGKVLSSEADVRQVLADRHVYAGGIVMSAAGMPELAFDQPVFIQEKFVGLLRAVIRLDTLQAMVGRNEKEGRYSFLLDQDGRLLSYPDRVYLGKPVSALFTGNHSSLENGGFKALMAKSVRGEEGSGMCLLFPPDSPHQAEEVIVSFAPVFFGGRMWSLISAIDYDAIAGPVNKNERDNIIFAGLVVLVLLLSGAAFYRDQKKKNAELQRLYKDLADNLDELKSTQSLLIQAAKMEVVGKVAAGVAHEVKNPLAVILLGVNYLKNNVTSTDPSVKESLEDIESAVSRADLIIRGLLEFSTTSELELRPQAVRSLIDKSLFLVKHLLKENRIAVIIEVDKNTPVICVDMIKIEQALVNLFVNAIQAMPAGGELRVSAFQGGLTDGAHWVELRIEDTGAGLPPSVIRDLFVPFVTTKRGSGGTGLGLSIVKNIMELHGGKIVLENR
ncbi:MAG: hypothetical protein HQL22_12440, partial [Candidatus Omnitrophica bacterium]|nr:hypothetical protein [Candidatus Omnitrophota bacterium]